MYKVPVIPAKGKATSRELPLPEEVNPHVLYEVVRWQLASRRRGTASTKTRGEVNYSTRKLFPQKGLGRARHGSRGANIFVGGGVVFGPKPRDYGYTLPKKVRRAGLAMALADRAREEKLLVVEAFAGVEGKTKQFVEWAGKHGLDGSERVTLVTADENVRRAARNLPWVVTLSPEGINVYDILRTDRLVLDEAALALALERAGIGGEA
ncbi:MULTISPECIES: 50S ribosomal protein L4 [Oceanithermus]|uniref:Large ribosomal subunit protein uL4 n=3 Tax=Oceanithermus TaxID=208447 RepID=A0A511RKW8_9DEIN|nr:MULTISPECIES: 50S ribosomal protein L4 [Oceanithermus]MBB6028654.1 large subunit ribosomal protein L4 [Oceanithermus desulfurans]GEM90303.1 50S ribosomal protein L4 [Oceanithermus desulfurans NBRC 100063]HHO58247.1 50S ribosomal protein L4 [Oceanithermus profundus]